MADGVAASLPNPLNLIENSRLAGGGPAPSVFYRSKAGICQVGYTKDSIAAIKVVKELAFIQAATSNEHEHSSGRQRLPLTHSLLSV